MYVCNFAGFLISLTYRTRTGSECWGHNRIHNNTTFFIANFPDILKVVKPSMIITDTCTFLSLSDHSETCESNILNLYHDLKNGE